MLYLYTVQSEVYHILKKIVDVDSYFNMQVSAKFNNGKYDYIMYKIDGVKSRDGDIIETPFGRTLITDLSSGCKAVLLALYHSNDNSILINVSECGENAIRLLFELADKVDIYVYITGRFIVTDSVSCVINGELVSGAVNIYKKLLY